jgi:hypothetical protein
MSDELAPIDLEKDLVHPFPLAATLKSPLASAYPLPPNVLSTHRAVYVPVKVLHSRIHDEPVPIRGMIFVQYSSSNEVPRIRKLGKAEAVARLYPNVLNALAHESMGLDQSIRLASSVPCYELASAELAATTAAVRSLLSDL